MAGGATEIITKDGPQALDFDSLGGAFATFLDGIDVSLKARQALMRYSSPRLTVNRYTGIRLLVLCEAARRRPVLITGPTSQSAGSDLDSTCTKLALTPAGEGGFGRVTAEGKEIGEQLSLLADQLENRANHVIRAERAGFEPAVRFYSYAALAKQCRELSNALKDSVFTQPATLLTLLLTQVTGDAELARLVEQWPTLPKETRAAILALISR